MGPLSGLIGMLPGMGAMKELKNANVDERELDRARGDHPLDDPEERPDPDADQRLAAANGSPPARAPTSRR